MKQQERFKAHIRLKPKDVDELAEQMLAENLERMAVFEAPFDPITGEGAPPLPRFEFSIEDVHWFLPESMREIKMIQELMRLGSVARFCKEYRIKGKEGYVRRKLIEERIKHDFCFWAISFATIKSKEGGMNIKFRLNYPQRKTLTQLEKMRLEGKPIRMIILKARQWGGSTLVQLYMAWIQLVLRENWYSAIVAHQTSSALNIRSMYKRMVGNYPPSLLGLDSKEPLTLTPYGGSRVDVTISQGKKQARSTVISVGSMQSPESVRGVDISMAHFSEVGLWRQTEGKSPEDVIQAISSAILDEPLTVDVMESTAKGENNLFHHEWLDAKSGISARYPMFVAWFEIEMYRKKFTDPDEMLEFVKKIIRSRTVEHSKNVREEPGAYIWKLWELGATLEAIQWYIERRKTYRSHDTMASEFPSDDIEAFAHSGQAIFDKYKVEKLRATCRSPKWLGEIHGKELMGEKCLEGLQFRNDNQGQLKVWEMPDKKFRHKDRYLVAVDVGGRSDKADYSVILVLDRWWRTEGEGDVVVAEWHGHIRHDLLAWKMIQIAKFYCDALLVVESNTFETRDNATEGEHTMFILDQIGGVYRNMYTREASPENIRMGRGRKWGFQTNVHTKALIIDNLISIIDDALYTEREEAALQEYNTYERDDKGGMNASEGYHDDRLMARAIGLYISQNMSMPRRVDDVSNKYKYKRKRKGNVSNF